jgi:hypothetical protein
MKIPTCFERCTICLERKPLTCEHIIPESIGGTLQADLQCEHCNSRLGSSVVSQAKKDPAIRLAILSLKDQLPQLYGRMEQGQLYTTVDDVGQTASAKFRDRGLRAKTQKMAGGSFIFDPKTAEKTIESMLDSRGLTPMQVNGAIEKFRNASIGELVKLSDEVSAVKREIKSAFPDLQFGEMDERVPVLISYNYLCLILGVQVFDTRFDFIRQRIACDEPSEAVKVEGLTSRVYRPFHKVHSEPEKDGLLVKIYLFGWLVYYVHFRDVIYGGPYVVYVEDLPEERSLLAYSVEEAEKGIFRSTKVGFPQEKPDV